VRAKCIGGIEAPPADDGLLFLKQGVHHLFGIVECCSCVSAYLFARLRQQRFLRRERSVIRLDDLSLGVEVSAA
jgi:hypothetical protein